MILSDQNSLVFVCFVSFSLPLHQFFSNMLLSSGLCVQVTESFAYSYCPQIKQPDLTEKTDASVNVRHKRKFLDTAHQFTLYTQHIHPYRLITTHCIALVTYRTHHCMLWMLYFACSFTVGGKIHIHHTHTHTRARAHTQRYRHTHTLTHTHIHTHTHTHTRTSLPLPLHPHRQTHHIQ